MMHRLLFVLFAVLRAIQAECPEGCDEPLLFYDELKCKPIYENSNDCCPVKYDCTNLEEYSRDKCVLNGKEYKSGEQIPDEETYGNCHVGCFCRDAKITCAVLDCPEWLGWRPEPGCHFKYELDKCCTAGQICPTKEDTFECKVGNATYKEGQRFSHPDEKCTTCVCKKDIPEPTCRKDYCTSEIRNADEIRDYCAAVYFPDSCCPFEFVCPHEKDKIVPGPEEKRKDDLKCKYGTKLLDLGDTFEREKTKCECKIPPFVTCIKSY